MPGTIKVVAWATLQTASHGINLKNMIQVLNLLFSSVRKTQQKSEVCLTNLSYYGQQSKKPNSDYVSSAVGVHERNQGIDFLSMILNLYIYIL